MLLTLLVLLLTSNALTIRREDSIYYSRIMIIGLIFTSYIAYNNMFITPLGYGIGVFGGLFNITTITSIFTIFICLITSTILTITGFYPRKLYIEEILHSTRILFTKSLYNKNIIAGKSGEQFHIIEYALIIGFVLSGAIFLMSSSDLISVFLSIELQSYGLYILSTLYRDSEIATGSGLTYFLLGGLSSCFILLGSGLLYIISGTTNLENIYLIINMFDVFAYPSIVMELDNNVQWWSSFDNWYKIYYLQLSIIIMIVGFLFKVSAAPFHFWSPEVYDGIPTVVTTFVAIIAKISIFIFLLEFVYYTESYLYSFSWKNILIISSLLSLVIGSILGLTQFRIKRLFAYSTISHVGFILLALSINSVESIQSFIFYLIQYSISNLNAFIILLAIGYSLFSYVYEDDRYGKEVLVDQNNSPIQLVEQIKGYYYINPFIAISLSITIFSFVGIPPIIGFFGKQMILSAALDNGYIFMSLVAIITSVIGAGYYLNMIKEIFFLKSNYETLSKELSAYIVPYNTENIDNLNNNKTIKKLSFNTQDIRINGSISASISILSLILILFIFTPNEWFNLVNILTLNLFKV